MNLLSRWNQLTGRSPGLLAAAPPVAAAGTGSSGEGNELSRFLQFVWDCGDKFGWEAIGINGAIAVVVALLLLWPAAKFIADPDRVLVRTLLFGASAIVLTAAFLALGYFAVQTGSMLLLALTGLAFGAIILTQTRFHFDATSGEAAGVLGSFVLLVCAASLGTEQLLGRMPWTNFVLKSNEDRGRLFAEWQSGKSAPAKVAVPGSAATTAPSVASAPAEGAPVASAANIASPAVGATTAPKQVPVTPRAATAPPDGTPNLAALYAQLQKARAELDVNDPAAVARFNQQAAAYNQEKALAAAGAAAAATTKAGEKRN